MVRNEQHFDLLIQDLNKMESYIQAFWQFLPVAVCYVNPALNILDVSHSFERLFGFKALEIVGSSLKKLFKNQEQIEAVQKELRSKGRVSNKRTVLISKAGKEIPVNLSAAPRKEEGEVTGFFFAFLDVSEQERFERQLQERLEELEKFRRLTEGRELRMIELKKRIRELEEELKKESS